DERVIGPGNVARAAGASAHTGRGFDHGADHLRVLAHAEVVVRAPDHDRARAVRRTPGRVGKTPGDALEIGKHAIAPLLLYAGKGGRKEMIIGHGAKPSFGLCSMIGDFDTRRIQRVSTPMRSAPSSVVPAEGRPVLGGKGPAAGPAWGRGRGARRAPSTCECCLPPRSKLVADKARRRE